MQFNVIVIKLKKVLFFSVCIISAILCSILIVLFLFGRDLPSEKTLLDYSPPVTTRIYSSENELLEEYAIERRSMIPVDKIPSLIKGAFLMAEDKDFYTHSGINIASIMRAVIDNTIHMSWRKKPAGGSTITQQVAKNLCVGSKKSLSRKIKEAIMAFRIEASIPKDKTLEIYLNAIYLGKGCYGIVEAFDYYFGKKLKDVTPSEAAFVASLPSAPSVYSNFNDITKLTSKRNFVLYQMCEQGYISQEELQKSIKEDIKIIVKKRKPTSKYFTDEIFRIFSNKISEEVFFKSGLSIITTIEKNTQIIAEKSLEDGLISYEHRQQYRGPVGFEKNKQHYVKAIKEILSTLPRTKNIITPVIISKTTNEHYECINQSNKKIFLSKKITIFKNVPIFEVGTIILVRKISIDEYELYQEPSATGAIIVMDPISGDIQAMSGGYSFDNSSFNCATQAQRQPGSTIKPFVYATALENGMDEYDDIEDKSVSIKLQNGKIYSPKNYNGKTYGITPLRDGLIYSRNLSTIDIALTIGMPTISKVLNKFGLIKSKKAPISAVLGSVETTLLRLTTAFSAFANGGFKITPNFVKDVSTYSNVKVNFPRTKEKLISESTTETIKSILHDAIQYGTSSSIINLEKEYNLKLYGKTGTTNDYKDAWFIGCIDRNKKSLIVGIFVGKQDHKSLGNNETGAKVALPIFANFIKNTYKKVISD